MGINDLLKNTEHRPWELQKGRWRYYQEWNGALFLHWKVPMTELAANMPFPEWIDDMDGQGWISLVAFTMNRIRPRGLPAVIGIIWIMEYRNKLRIFHSITEMQRVFGLPQPLHPLISMLDYSKVEITAEMVAHPFVMDFYTITYNESAGCRMKYGQTIYDFEEGGLSFTSPGQSLTGIQTGSSDAGFTLLIHPDFMRNYTLDVKIKNYGFFAYSVNESLHLSAKEKKIISMIAQNIGDELETAIDDISQDVLISQIELLLNYSQRFYKRQFITRKPINNALLERLDIVLDNYLNDQVTLMNGLPTVQFLADKLNVSPRYLGDMLRTLTGQNTQQHIHQKLIEKAKEVLAISDLTVGEVAYQLGFEHPQSFSKFFKSKTNMSPLEFRAIYN